MIRRNEVQAVYLNNLSHYSNVEQRFLEVREGSDNGDLVVLVNREVRLPRLLVKVDTSCGIRNTVTIKRIG